MLEAIAAVLLVMLAVFEVTLVSSAVMLAVLALTLFVNINSAS